QVLEEHLAPGHGLHLVAVLLENPGERAGEGLVVVGDEDLGGEAHSAYQTLIEDGSDVPTAHHGDGRPGRVEMPRDEGRDGPRTGRLGSQAGFRSEERRG